MANDVSYQTTTLATPANATKVASFQLGTSSAHAQVMSPGANASAAVAAGASSASVIKATAGILARVLVTTAGSNAMELYDNASAGSGTMVGLIPANSQPGTVCEFNMPCANGITAKGNASNPAVTIAYA